MKSTIQRSVNRFLLLFALAFAVFSVDGGNNKANALPYCAEKFDPAGYTSYSMYDFFSYFARVAVQKSTTPSVDEYARNASPVDPIPPANRGTGREGYKYVQSPPINLKIGNTYQFRLNVHGWGGVYTRMFIDLNGDGDFSDVVNGQSEYRGTYYTSHGNNYDFNYDYPDYYLNNNMTIYFTGLPIPCNSVPVTNSRIRFMTSYSYNNGSDPCVNGYYYAGSYTSTVIYGEIEDYNFNIVPDAPSSFPAEDALLYAKEPYNGTVRDKNGVNVNFTKPGLTFVGGAPVNTTIKMSIRGPLPLTETVWTALDPSNGSSTITITTPVPAGGTYTIGRSTGKIDADYNEYSPGNNGSFNMWIGGEYQLVIEVGGAGCPGAVVRNFTAALDYDIAAKAITSPRTNGAPSFTKYQNNSDIKVTGMYMNVGLNDIHKFKAIARIYRPDGILMQEAAVDYDDKIPPFTTMTPGQQVEVDFGIKFRTNAIGIYTIKIFAEWAADQGEFNNVYPRSDAPDYGFEVQYDIQVAANKIFAPAQGEKLVANRPYVPRAEFINYGISPVSDVLVTYQAKKASTGEVVYQQTKTLEDISSGRYNTNSMTWGQMVIPEPGDYVGCIWINDANDIVNSDDTLCVNFTVESGIQGTFTLGKAKETVPGYKVDRNFETVDELMNALYYEGMSGSTVIEFTDAEYILNAPNQTAPAWDLSSKIIGLGMNDFTQQIQTLTFKPAITKIAEKGGVVFKLRAASGMGLKFGQNLLPTNMNAIARSFPTKQNAKAAGYITFDGGLQKTIKFQLEVLPNGQPSSQMFGAAVYMDRGTENITIKNCLLESITPQIRTRVNIPNVAVTSSETRYDQDAVSTPQGWQSYSAGVVSRNTLLPLTEQANLGLDTINNANNVIADNEISQFGYGIVSLGAGPLFDVNVAKFLRYYNNNNKYENNTIYDVTRAGILVGYEENSSIKGNRIHTLTGAGANRQDAAGIMVGGQGSTITKGYSNIGLVIDGNEISGVNSSVSAIGIRVEQVKATFGTGNNITSFPNVNESLTIMNNVVWGINVSSANAVRAGISLSTERANPQVFNGQNVLLPRVNDYFTRNDKVVNNTVVIDKGTNLPVGVDGALVGIGLQSTTNTLFKNNAIAILDQNVDNNNALSGTVVLYQGVRYDKPGATTFDRNAYYTGTTTPLLSNISLIRYVEVAPENQQILSTGAYNEYLTLEQWQAASKQDANSVVGNFTNDLVKVGVAPFSYTVKSNPTPLGSILNNRGEKLSTVTTDIDGTARGVAGLRYDIGAVEFAGRINLNDVEMMSIIEPRSYQSATGAFSDAQYIMTKAPVNVVGRIRNNGSLLQTEMEVTVKVYRQNTDGLSFSTTPLLTKVVKASIASSESVNADFLLANGDANDFVPQTYYELEADGYVVPAIFKTMKQNVTPIYRIEMSVEADQENSNNVVTKDVRFYLTKTNREILVSGQGLSVDVNNPGSADNLMARLNYNFVVAGLTDINYRIRLSDPKNPLYDYDVFDRTAWEARAVDYSQYAFLFYADGNNSSMPRTEVESIQSYLAKGNATKKRNIMIGSEELARYAPADFTRKVLRTEYISNNPNGNGTSYNNGKMVGDQLAKKFEFLITQPINPLTQVPYVADLQSYPAVIKELNSYTDKGRTINLPGLASAGIRYAKGNGTDVSAVVSSTLETNTIYVGADWRHVSNVGILMRGAISYFETNGSVVVPVELTDFTAKQINNNVAITWETESETNTALFEVEKANVNTGSVSAFAKIASKEAAGFSKTNKFYGPVVDNQVAVGNTYAYRLKTIDRDGSASYSDERIVSLTSEAGVVTLGNATPNPATDNSSLELTLSQNNDVVVIVYDLNGNVVNTLNFNGVSGANRINLDFVNLASGSYTAVVKVGDVSLSRTINVVK